MTNTTITSTKSTFLPSQQPTTNFGGSFDLIYHSGTVQTYCLVEFDLSSLNGAIIDTATLRLTNRNVIANSGTAAYAYVGRCDQAWDENAATYNNRPGAGITNSGYRASWGGGLTDVDVASDIVFWVGGAANNGFLISGPTAGDYQNRWESDDAVVLNDRPQLIVDYQLAAQNAVAKYLLPQLTSNPQVGAVVIGSGHVVALCEANNGYAITRSEILDAGFNGLRTFALNVSDPYNMLKNQISGYDNIVIYEFDGLQTRKTRGIIEDIQQLEGEPPLARRTLITGRGYGLILANRFGSTDQSDNEVTRAMRNLITNDVSELEVQDRYVRPTAKTLGGTFPSSGEQLQYTFITLDQIAAVYTATGTTEYGFYVCQQDHFDELRPNFHHEKLGERFTDHILIPNQTALFDFTQSRRSFFNKIIIEYGASGGNFVFASNGDSIIQYGAKTLKQWFETVDSSGTAQNIADGWLAQLLSPKQPAHLVLPYSLDVEGGVNGFGIFGAFPPSSVNVMQVNRVVDTESLQARTELFLA